MMVIFERSFRRVLSKHQAESCFDLYLRKKFIIYLSTQELCFNFKGHRILSFTSRPYICQTSAFSSPSFLRNLRSASERL